MLLAASVSCHKKAKKKSLSLSRAEKEELQSYFEWIAAAEETPVVSSYHFKRKSNDNQYNCIDGQFGCSTGVVPEIFYTTEVNRLLQLICEESAKKSACSADVCHGLKTTYELTHDGRKHIADFKITNAVSGMTKEIQEIANQLVNNEEVIALIKNHAQQLYAGFKCTLRAA